MGDGKVAGRQRELETAATLMTWRKRPPSPKKILYISYRKIYNSR
jgi:hypothetical protein